MKIVRGIGAVIVGMIVAILLVLGAEAISHQIYPPPPGMSMKDMTKVKAFVATLPMSVLLIVLAGHLIATFVATWTAAKIARGPIAGFIVGTLLLAGGIVNAFTIPQPAWFSIASFVIYIGATWVGARAGMPRRAEQT
ncbi:MAG TPA: hypothetical protein VN380_02705 [Thermoanaerobaculia bacterium]|jgi:hypothetical protein|nr:hypothetical protein [Thermoanaerobaculia bacterium]